jgi:hypothetical protein
LALVTPSPFTFSAFTCCMTEGELATSTSMWPPIRSAVAGPIPW